VFRSADGGESWKRISPAGHNDIRNIESIAVDPANPAVIYAGTWHLPWKTANAGQSWEPMHNGILDDSDVFSIIVDFSRPSVVYASACSGIYKSESSGTQFRKIQGIPSSARRTRVLKQDPRHPNVVYAGTTQGLWKTVNSGHTWARASKPSLIVNDIFIDPADTNHVLLATDRSGVLASRDGSASWLAANRGFSHRHVTSVLMDRAKAGVIYAGMVNDKEFGGVFVSRDSGKSWTQFSRGLAGHDVFVLAQDEKGTLLAGTEDNVFQFSPKSGIWMKRYLLPKTKVRVTDLDVSGRNWLAGTTRGLFYSPDRGLTWKPQPQLGRESLIAVRSHGQVAAAASSRKLFLSIDGGLHWRESQPPAVSYLQAMAVDKEGTVWVASPQGAFRRNSEANWEKAPELPQNVGVLHYESSVGMLYAIAGRTEIFVHPAGQWRHLQSSQVPIRRLAWSQDRLYAGSQFDGVVELPASLVALRDTQPAQPQRTGSAAAGRP
jgi:photosystem II stability/assembly factor-like uncharacterized protein